MNVSNMSLPITATNEQVEKARAWVKDFYNGINLPDVNDWVTKFFKPEAILNIDNLLPVKGRKEISEKLEKERAKLSFAKQKIKHVDVFSDRIYVQVKSIYIVNNDPEQTEIKIKTILVIWKKVNEDKLSSMDVYLDPNPLLEQIKKYSK